MTERKSLLDNILVREKVLLDPNRDFTHIRGVVIHVGGGGGSSVLIPTPGYNNMQISCNN